MEAMRPTITHRHEDGYEIPLLFWRFTPPQLVISSGPLGGGIGLRHWLINATVPMSYCRADPGAHLAELAGQIGLDGPGAGLLTGVDVADVVTAVDEEVTVWATVGLGAPIWAASTGEAIGGGERGEEPTPVREPAVGTVNIVVRVPVRMSEAALVNAVATVAEAKAQALWEVGLAATGTATDATCVLCPTGGAPAAYGGPRSTWGSRIARAVRQAVRTGATAGGEGHLGTAPWSDRYDMPG